MTLGMKRVCNEIKGGIQNIRDRARKWYDCKFYPVYGRRIVYYLSFDIKGLKESLGEKSAIEVLKHPRDFFDHFELKSVIRWKNKYLREKERRKQYPEKLTDYKNRVRELTELLEQVKREKSGFQNLYLELDASIEAMKTRLASGELESQLAAAGKEVISLEESVAGLEKNIRSLRESEVELGTRYGEQMQRANSLETELASSKKSNLKQHEELARLREEYNGLEATLFDRDKLIGMLKRSVNKREERFIQEYLYEIVEFINRNPGALLAISSGLVDGKIIIASDDAKDILHYNGDLVGKRYLDLLAFDDKEKRRALVRFSSPDEQRYLIPFVSRERKTEHVRAAWKPIKSREPGEEGKHLFTILTLSSYSWLDMIRGKYKNEDLEIQVSQEEARRKTKEHARKLAEGARKQRDGSP